MPDNKRSPTPAQLRKGALSRWDNEGGASPDGPQEAPLRMAHQFKVGDHVRWNSEAGHVTGRIVKVHTRDTDYKGHTHRCTPEDPQYEIKSDKTDHIALHRGAVLHRID